MRTIRNNEDFAELATDRNEVMFRKVRHRKSECIRSNQRTSEIIISGNKAYQIWLTGLILISVTWRRVVRQEWGDLGSSWVVVILAKCFTTWASSPVRNKVQWFSHYYPFSLHCDCSTHQPLIWGTAPSPFHMPLVDLPVRASSFVEWGYS